MFDRKEMQLNSAGKRKEEVIAELLPKNRPIIGAEVGSCEGWGSMKFLSLIENLEEFWLVDVWSKQNKQSSYVQSGDNLAKINNRTWVKHLQLTIERIKDYWGKTRIIQCDAIRAARLFDDQYFDFVFLDADHSYEATKEAIQTWKPKIKNGGILAGHDYGQPFFPGVAKAVHECIDDFSISHDWTWVHVVKHKTSQ